MWKKKIKIIFFFKLKTENASGQLKSIIGHPQGWKIPLLKKKLILIFLFSHYQNNLFQCVLPLSIHNYEQHTAAQSEVKEVDSFTMTIKLPGQGALISGWVGSSTTLWPFKNLWFLLFAFQKPFGSTKSKGLSTKYYFLKTLESGLWITRFSYK